MENNDAAALFYAADVVARRAAYKTEREKKAVKHRLPWNFRHILYEIYHVLGEEADASPTRGLSESSALGSEFLLPLECVSVC